jgi:hypothetical protein
LTNNNFEVDITPSVTTYELYQIASYTHWFALGEFIDNSITSAFLNWDQLNSIYEGDFELQIDIDFDNQSKSLTIIDNAAGIDGNDIQRALRAGEPPANKSLLSVHGVGMKMSSFWLGRNLNIRTWPINQKNGYEVTIDLDIIKQTRSAKTKVQEISNRDKCGTIIQITKINEEKLPKGTGVAKLKSLLTSMYRIYLTDSEKIVKINFNGKPLVYKKPKILFEPYWADREGPIDQVPILWERDFEFKSEKGQKIRGKVGLLETMSRDLSGFMLHYKGKGMGGIGSVESSEEINQQDIRDSREYYRPAKIFGQEGSYRYQRFTGQFDISDFGKTSSTDSIKWDPDEEHDFIESLCEFLKDPEFNLWSMAENFQVRKAIKLKEGIEETNTSSFSLEDVVSLSEYFNNQIHGEKIHHAENESESENEFILSRSLSNLDNSQFISSSKHLLVPDSQGHIHEFIPQFVDDVNFNLYFVNSISEDKHEIKINVGHPFIRRLQWGNPDVREAVIQMIYLMSVPEVFLPLRISRSSFRDKVNEIVDATLNRVGQDQREDNAS